MQSSLSKPYISESSHKHCEAGRQVCDAGITGFVFVLATYIVNEWLWHFMIIFVLSYINDNDDSDPSLC